MNFKTLSAFVLLASLAYGMPAPGLAGEGATHEQVTFAAGTLVEPQASVHGELKLPAAGEKLPAVVLIHDSGGLADRAGSDYVEALNQAGFATLELDLFARGHAPKSGRTNFPHMYGALIFLAHHPRIDPSRIGVMGFSYGANLSLFAATGELTQQYTGGKYRFAAHLSLYPVCWVHADIVKGRFSGYPATLYESFTGAPVHILAGAKDDYEDDPEACPKFVALLPEPARKLFGVTVYPDAGHGWDTHDDRSYKSKLSHRGQGGYVKHYRNDAVAEQSRLFAVKFFTSTLRE